MTSCGPDEVPCGLLPVFETDAGALLSLDRCTGTLAVGTAADPEALLPGVAASREAIAWADDDVTVSIRQGRFTFDGIFDLWHASTDGESVAVGLWSGGTEEVPATLLFEPGPRGSIHLRLDVHAEVDRVSIAFGCNEGERWYGTGARPQGTDHSGTRQMLYAAEQGIGQRDYDLDEWDLLSGRIGDTYFPVPWTVSDRGIGVAIGGTPVSRMSLCSLEENGVLRFEAWGTSLDLFVFPSGSPREAVSDWTLASGPPVAAPDWAYGPWVAVQRGTDELLATAERLRAEEIPATALWAQDWIGGRDSPLGGYDLHYHWEWDEELYPALPEAIETLHLSGFAFLGYFNPFITEGFDEWTEANEFGYLPVDSEGEPYTFTIVDRFGSQVDLLDPEARQWAKEYFQAATDMGQDGWMCDFAEWLPFDSIIGDGESGLDWHNAYPLQWQELNMEVLNEHWGPGAALCFNRSGWAGTQAIAPVTWGGDQETSWDRDDGLPTAREIGVGLGLSGIGRYGSDIAGFSSVFTDASTKELYLRWVEMAAFEPVMRTHDGLAEGENWHWEADAETLEHYRRYSVLHLRLLPLLKLLDADYMDRGLPFLRHTILVETGAGPSWEALRDAPDQHFLGDDLLVAPVVTEGATSRSVVFPQGLWYGLLDGTSVEVADAPTAVEVPAPLGTIPVFGRAGSILPMADATVMTTYPESSADVVGSADRADRLHLVLFWGDGGTIELDGATWTFATVGELGPFVPSLDQQGLAPECAEAASTNCRESDDPTSGTAVYRLDWGTGSRHLEGVGWTLDVDNAAGRSGTVTLRYPSQNGS